MRILSVEGCQAPATKYYSMWRAQIGTENGDENIEEIITECEKLNIGETYAPEHWTVDVTRVG